MTYNMAKTFCERREPEQNRRNSGVELLKITTVFLIVISHVTQTLCATDNTWVDFNDYVFPLGNATADASSLILMLFFQLGSLANDMFFVCSAWYLVGKKGNSRKKSLSLLCSVWCVSVLILAIYLTIGHYSFSSKEILMQLLPTTYGNNWYMTCYIIFLFMYPYLNRLIEATDRKHLFRIVLFTSLLWILADYGNSTLFFSSNLILWVTIYFLTAYIRTYCVNTLMKLNVAVPLLLTGILGSAGQVFVTNYAGLHFNIFADSILRWNNCCSPFYIMTAFGALMIALQSHRRNRFINKRAGLTLFVYLIHENILFRHYTRPKIWQWLYMTFGYKHVVLLDLGFSILLFILSFCISAVYKNTVQRLVSGVSDRLYEGLAEIFGRIEGRITRDNG